MLNKIKLKICGMRDANNIRQIAALHPDYMGFIFYRKSPRYVGETFELQPDFPAEIKRVGVFVNESTEAILQQVERLKLHYLQLHGKESVEQCESLKSHDIKIIKAFSVDDDFDFNETRQFKQVADFFLFDTKGKYHGGNARTFNWNVLKRYDQETPFFLSGGLTPDNVKDVTALHDMNIHALDLNSGIESRPGFKDSVKVKNILSILNSKF